MTRRRVPKRYLVVAGVAIILAIAVVVRLSSADKEAPRPPAVATTATATASASPDASATPESEPGLASPVPDPSEGEAAVEVPPTSAAPASGHVDVMVAFIGWEPATQSVEATGYAAAVDAGGECVLALTRGSETVRSKPVPAVVDATTMSCGTLSIPGSDLRAGEWQATLTYTSSAYSGTSDKSAVEVPE